MDTEADIDIETYLEPLVKPTLPHLPHIHDAARAKLYADDLADYEVELKEFNVQQAQRATLYDAAVERFKINVMAELGLQDNPKADTLWNIAWTESSGSNGCKKERIRYWLTRLSELVT